MYDNPVDYVSKLMNKKISIVMEAIFVICYVMYIKYVLKYIGGIHHIMCGYQHLAGTIKIDIFMTCVLAYMGS